ncbi:Uncharacterised protein [Salmonella enterica subsp. enterica]|uniref:Uncharacterized protein n=1 Tax=Salmonella enterica I TaxID=59201 RepID=A0A447MUY6_SALET|nr:Uncharacterised protein [Salmonella enterica subsp. enterica]
MQRKTAETADFNTLALRKSRGHMLQHLFYRVFNRLSGKCEIAGLQVFQSILTWS